MYTTEINMKINIIERTLKIGTENVADYCIKTIINKNSILENLSC